MYTEVDAILFVCNHLLFEIHFVLGFIMFPYLIGSFYLNLYKRGHTNIDIVTVAFNFNRIPNLRITKYMFSNSVKYIPRGHVLHFATNP